MGYVPLVMKTTLIDRDGTAPYNKTLIFECGMLTLTIPLRDCKNNYEMLVNRHTDIVEFYALAYLCGIYKGEMLDAGIDFANEPISVPIFFYSTPEQMAYFKEWKKLKQSEDSGLTPEEEESYFLWLNRQKEKKNECIKTDD